MSRRSIRFLLLELVRLLSSNPPVAFSPLPSPTFLSLTSLACVPSLTPTYTQRSTRPAIETYDTVSNAIRARLAVLACVAW
ncbi:hypothetical protein BDQ12DRAFT_693440 [Crucibulum laeve]|uniref:Secreted protein n=1 Tax=Crucibulum laeve TaxID=68775 RepID=A0A5C3LGM1_9AGAR|nr:hypothetical protein BDQ12DRAFT_693440 [Crucibulum laeve]